MKVFAAATKSESGDYAMFVSTSKDGIYEQIVEMGRCEYGDRSDYEDSEWNGDFLTFEDFLFDKYWIVVDEEVDL